MTLENWNNVLQFLSAVLLGLTFAIGAGAAWTSYRLGKRHQEHVAEIARDAATANKLAAEANVHIAEANENTAKLKERTAQAELKLEELRRGQGARHIDVDEFVSVLANKARGRAVIWYMPDDGEARSLALQLHAGFGQAGWQVAEPEPIPADFVRWDSRNEPPERIRRLPAMVRVGSGAWGISLAARVTRIDRPDTIPYAAAHVALVASRFSFASMPDPELPPDTVRIVVGPKP